MTATGGCPFTSEFVRSIESATGLDLRKSFASQAYLSERKGNLAGKLFRPVIDLLFSAHRPRHCYESWWDEFAAESDDLDSDGSSDGVFFERMATHKDTRTEHKSTIEG